MLWARVLNLKSLSKGGDEWRKEVIRRTGTAPLHIKAVKYDPEGYDVVQFMEELLDQQWSRIRSLDLHFSSSFQPDENPWRRLFARPAPSLEVFQFSWPGQSKYLSNPNFVPRDFVPFELFANEAPVLETLFAADMTLDLTALSVPRLRSLVLHSSMHVYDLLSALNGMPSLESLEASIPGPVYFSGCCAPKRPPLPQVSLPRLTYIRVSVGSELEPTLSLLAHVTPANGCVLDLFGTQMFKSPDSHWIDLYSDTLSKYSENCPQLETATQLIAHVTEDRFMIGVAFPYGRRFFVSFGTTVAKFSEQITSRLLNSFTTLRFEHVKAVTLSLGREEAFISNPDVINLVCGLISVEVVGTKPQTLQSIQMIESNCAIVAMPALKVVHLTNISDQAEVPLVVDFFDSRIKNGISVSNLKIQLEGVVDLEPLRKFDGLKIQISRDGGKYVNF